MAKGTRRKHSSALKAKIALVAMAGDKTLADLAITLEVCHGVDVLKEAFTHHSLCE